MNFYYELKLNFNDERKYEFYEWSESDCLDYIKKIPVVKIENNTFKKICNYNFKVDSNFLEKIYNKTIVKGENYLIDYACIFCDTRNCIAVEFDKEGNSIARSSLMLEDENNICEISYSFKYRDIDIEKLKKLNITYQFRQEEQIKNIIKTEINNLYEKKDYSKFDYLYYEWFNKENNNHKIMLEELLEDLNNNFNKNHYKIYQIIKLSYNNV